MQGKRTTETRIGGVGTVREQIAGRKDCRIIPAVERRTLKGALYRIWCGLNRLGVSGVKVV